MSNISRLLVFPGVAILLSVWILYEGLSQPAQNMRAFAFANGTAITMLVLSLIWFLAEFAGWIKTAPGTVRWQPVCGGLIGMVIYVLLIRVFGIWLTSLALFVAIGYLYNGERNDGRAQIITISGGLAFMLVLYALFNWLLQVQMPQGWLGLI